MSLFVASDFASNSVDTPSGAGSLIDTGNVSIIKSDGTTQIVFDTLTTGLKCLNFMNANNMYYITSSDNDISILNLNVKLLIIENTFQNQKLINSFCINYAGKNTMCIHRNLSSMMSLFDALIATGYKSPTTTPYNSNSDLETSRTADERVFIKICDYYYFSTNGSLLNDTTQIIF